MKITRKTRILTIERKFIIFPAAASRSAVCRTCGGQMILAHVSAEQFGISSREIYRLIEADKIHFVETAESEMYICPASIEKTAAARTR